MMAWGAGGDGCRGGWVVVLLDTGSGHSGHRLIERFQEVFELVEKPAVVGVDIPVGLLERAVKGGRQCDREVRPILGQPRARSVSHRLCAVPCTAPITPRPTNPTGRVLRT